MIRGDVRWQFFRCGPSVIAPCSTRFFNGEIRPGHVPAPAHLPTGQYGVFTGDIWVNMQSNESGLETPRMIGVHESMQQLHEQVRRIAGYPVTVLIHGESGTGKELVAQSLHALSPRADNPMIPVDCSTLRDTLFESQLFGHVRGAFTNAERETLGFIRAADGGTLFLDEIGELPLDVQAKLLRCVQEGQVIPLGGIKPVKVDVRIIAATHRNLQDMVADGLFRADLYHRLNQTQLYVPPLRERLEDLWPLCEHFLQQIADQFQEPRRHLSDGAFELLAGYHWPGNVRELGNVLTDACLKTHDSTIYPYDLPSLVQEACAVDDTGSNGQGIWDLELMTRHLVERALLEANGCQSRAARLINVERRRFGRMVKRFQLNHLTRRR